MLYKLISDWWQNRLFVWCLKEYSARQYEWSVRLFFKIYKFFIFYLFQNLYEISPRLRNAPIGGLEPVVVPQHGQSCGNVWGSLWLVHTWESTHWSTRQYSDWKSRLVEKAYPEKIENCVIRITLHCVKQFLYACKADKGIKSPDRMVFFPSLCLFSFKNDSSMQIADEFANFASLLTKCSRAKCSYAHYWHKILHTPSHSHSSIYN